MNSKESEFLILAIGFGIGVLITNLIFLADWR